MHLGLFVKFARFGDAKFSEAPRGLYVPNLCLSPHAKHTAREKDFRKGHYVGTLYRNLAKQTSPDQKK